GYAVDFPPLSYYPHSCLQTEAIPRNRLRQGSMRMNRNGFSIPLFAILVGVISVVVGMGADSPDNPADIYDRVKHGYADSGGGENPLRAAGACVRFSQRAAYCDDPRVPGFLVFVASSDWCPLEGLPGRGN